MKATLHLQTPEYFLFHQAVNGGLMFSATCPGCQYLPQLIRPWSCRSTSLTPNFLVLTGNAFPVVWEGGWQINCVRITTLRPTCDVPSSGEAISERRYGPRWLRVNDYDDRLYKKISINNSATVQFDPQFSPKGSSKSRMLRQSKK